MRRTAHRFATFFSVVGRLDPRRARDLQERREIYERRARSLRYGAVRTGSVRHLAQVAWRTLTELRRPGRLLLFLVTAGSVLIAASGLGLDNTGLVATELVALPLILLFVTFGQFLQETRRARRRRANQTVRT